MTPGQTTGEIGWMERSPGIGEARCQQRVVRRRPIPMKCVSVEIACDDDGKIGGSRAVEKFLGLQQLDLRDRFLFQMGADAAEGHSPTDHVHRAPPAQYGEPNRRDLEQVTEIAVVRVRYGELAGWQVNP